MDTDDLLAKYLMSFDAHYKLVTIHPWVDGNGRMSRLVMNHLQYELGLVPTKIIKEEKAEYIQALVDSREQESLEPFREFMLEEHTRNIAKEIEEYKKSQAFDPMNGYSGQKNDQKNKKWPENWPKKWPEKASQILDSMAANPSITIAEMEACLNVGHTTLKKILHEMQSEGIIRRVGPDKGGHWEVVSESH